MVKEDGGSSRGDTAWIRYGGDRVKEVGIGRLGLRHLQDSVPWRQVRSRHGQKHLPGTYWSSTMGGFVIYESRLELARLLLADFDPEVVAIRAQPLWLRHGTRGRVRRHVPDFLLTLRDGSARVVNVKLAERLEDPKVAEALAWPAEVFSGCGWGYEVWSGFERVVLENIRFLAGYRRPGTVDQRLVEQVWDAIEDGDELAIAELKLGKQGPVEDVRPAILSLLWRGSLTTDLARPLSGRSVLSRCR
ncbi:TnsA endonuclease N terminal [Streptomyces sp. Ncost-T6T-1]|uniref:TnsA-like heteromeric transposase endonuclease subunit n=1 Tax=Streptomyces sp. Ncost-T6T-1 TaxID=1100828 RepID=UPI0008047E61|nr:TnsA-like heteromeric transposase endonuclease subunit [Streptomyces sp. Ncost-T6T-1]SBU96842.1 TnsA endonuclease N terminal [Streptomyces sp. Ncost-T6T-1]